MEGKKDEGRDTPEGRRGKFGSKEHERKMKNVMRAGNEEKCEGRLEKDRDKTKLVQQRNDIC